MTARRRTQLIFGSIAAAGLIAAGCGDLESEGDEGGRGDLTAGTTTTNTVRPERDLPPRPEGVVQQQGELDGSLAPEIRSRFVSSLDRTGLAIQYDTIDSNEELGLEALCNGETDIVNASRLITEAELEACGENGLKVVDFQVAFDAIVIATRNERDVGADCVNFEQLRQMFGAGSNVTSWAQLNPNFNPLRLVPTGPVPDASDFSFFASRVLGVPNATLAAFRGDYEPKNLEQQIKNRVARSEPGVVGIVGFSFYELFEDELRPLEIDGQTGDRCVFPSAETIASEAYPLERTLRLYTTTRSLRRQEVQQVIEFYLRRASQIAADLELIPISEQLRQDQIDSITNPVPISAETIDNSPTERAAGQTGSDGSTEAPGEADSTTGDAEGASDGSGDGAEGDSSDEAADGTSDSEDSGESTTEEGDG